MPNLMPSDITHEVTAVLQNAARGDGNVPNFLTAYQILDRLPDRIRTRLIAERTLGGRGSGVSYAAPSVVSAAAEMLQPNVEIRYLDNRGITLQVASTQITPGFEVCGLYRWIP